MLNIVAVIPARLASSRFPRKILFPFHGLPMVEHVRRRALQSRAVTKVFVATPDPEIATVVDGFGGNVITTSDQHLNGTTRVAEAITDIDCSHVLLLQGDEPLLLPRHLELFSQAIAANPNGDAWNATGVIEEASELDRHSFVKCVVSESERIVYCFRRTPFFSPFEVQKRFIKKMLGIIAFRKDFLLQLTSLSPPMAESAESIEQLRIIDYGFQLQSVSVSPSLPSVNEVDEVEIVNNLLITDPEQREMLSRTLGHNAPPLNYER